MPARTRRTKISETESFEQPERSSSRIYPTLFERISPILFVALVVMSFVIGALWQKVQFLEKGGTPVAGNTVPNAQAPAGPSPLRVEALKAYAKELKLNESSFNSCLDEGKTATLVQSELDYGAEKGVSGTPGFFVNGHYISGAHPYATFKAVIDFLAKGGDLNKPDDTVSKYVTGAQAAVSATKVDVEIGNSPVKGSASAPITIIEFSDFECPYCGAFYQQTYKQIVKEYVDTGKVKFVYKHYPLSFHPNAQKAAEAAACAAEQGKFWEMHDKLFDAQKQG